MKGFAAGSSWPGKDHAIPLVIDDFPAFYRLTGPARFSIVCAVLRQSVNPASGGGRRERSLHVSFA